MVRRDIIAIGGSAGAFDVVQELVSRLPADLDAAIFLTLHQSERGEGILPGVLNRVGPLLALHPWDEQPIQKGHIYVAPPDYHLLLTGATVHLGHGPRENLHRPCINTMFRSAAAHHGERVSGLLLSGMLDDGAAGLWEIQQRGGATIVQDPKEAAYRSMPESAIRGLNVQYILTTPEIAPLLTRLTMAETNGFRPLHAPAPEGELTRQACPECGGVMRVRSLGRLKEFSCHVGHRFGLKTMIAEKSGTIERAMWKAVGQSEELLDLLEQERAELDPSAAEALAAEIAQRQQMLETMRTLVERETTSALLPDAPRPDTLNTDTLDTESR